MLVSILTAGVALMTTCTAAAAIEKRATSYHAPKGTGEFNLQVIATGGKLDYSGMWLSTYHTGAGLNALVAETDQTAATKFKFNATSGTIYATLGDYPYSLSIKGESYYAPPKDYSYIGFNVGDEGAGFYFNTPQNYLQFPAADKNDRFAVCPTVIYTPGDFVPTLLFRDSGAKKNATCADVKVKAVF